VSRARPRLRRRLAALAVAAVAAALTAVAAAAWLSTPTPTALQARVQARLAGTGGRAVAAGALAPILRDAVVATEDERFYRHHGIDVVGVLRSLPYDLTHFSLAQGASTITEQAAKLLYLDGNDHSPWRKAQDAALALKLESRYGKGQILAAYLDSAYFGEHAYGVRAASRAYFGVAPRRLDTAQASLLAGLIQAPSVYDPRRHPRLARARQVDVLRSLVRDGYVTVDEASAVLARPLRLSGGAALAPVRGVRLAPGPAFVWWQLTLGAAVTVLATAALALARLPRFRLAHGIVALRIVSVVVALLGIGAATRAFRSA
jgi:membrane peptidoglycan carboxypeptidase